MPLRKLAFRSTLFLALAVFWLWGGLPKGITLLEDLGVIAVTSQNIDLAESLKRNSRLSAVRIVAEIESVRDPLRILRDVRPGELITGIYVFDRDEPDATPDPTSGNYRFSTAPCGVVLEVGGHRLGTDPRDVDFRIDIKNFDAGNQFSFVSRQNISQPALENDHCEGQVDLIWWYLHDFAEGALANDDLPTGSLDLANWQSVVGLRVEGTATDFKSGAESPFLITAKVIRTEPVRD